MKYTDIRNVKTEGELRCRVIKNFSRLHDRIYRPGAAGVGECRCAGWPGDWEGRAMLALVLDEETLRTDSAFLKELIDWIYSLFNDEGYRSEEGDRLNLSDINEQMHSAQNWLMRAFMEYCRITGEEKYLDTVKGIIRKLYLPILPHLKNYPCSAADRETASDRAVIGHTAGSFREWRLSSDTGCIFMCFDALGQAWEMITEEPLHTQIGQLISALLDGFRRMDYVNAGLQTHATLTCMRGVMRIYGITGDRSLLDLAEKFFSDFVNYGMTVHYANINNFLGAGHTEPCGIVDSFMLANQLFDATGKRGYLDMANSIWHNALMRAQRENGGFGCDMTGRDGILGVFGDFYEAYWCCTMRGAEGLGYPARHALACGENTITLPFYFDFTATPDAGTEVRVRTGYPHSGDVSFEVLRGGGETVKLRICLPEWATDPLLTVNGKAVTPENDGCFVCTCIKMNAGTRVGLAFPLPLRAVPCRRFWHENEGRCTLEYGTLVLGTDADFDGEISLSDLVPDGQGGFDAYGMKFTPFDADYLLSRDEIMKKKQRILFRVKNRSVR